MHGVAPETEVLRSMIDNDSIHDRIDDNVNKNLEYCIDDDIPLLYD